MVAVTVRDLRNRGGDIIDRVLHGESLVVTRDGDPVAELRPLPRRAVTTRDLIARRRSLPAVDDAQLKRDVDAVLDASL